MARKRVWDREFLKGLLKPDHDLNYECKDSAAARSLRFALYREAREQSLSVSVTNLGRTLCIVVMPKQ